MSKTNHKYYINVNNRKYFYTFSKTNKKGVIYFECKAANIAQEFLSEDIPGLLLDLPEMILDEKKYRNKDKDLIRFRVTLEDKKAIEKKALKLGYKSVSSFLRDLALGKE